MRVLVTGSHGFIGSAVVPALAGVGHEVIRLVRSQPTPGGREVSWDPSSGTLDRTLLTGIDAVVHLAGESVAFGRWTARRKAGIRDSRVLGTRLLCDAVAALPQPPRVAVCASAVGYYGDRGDEVLTEASASGSGFLAAVCREWEAAAEPAIRCGIRVVMMRFGIVLHPAGGALKMMLRPFQFGLGGPLGNGRQYMSWVALDDVVGAIEYALTHNGLRGPVNVIAPTPVTNRDFTRTLARLLKRPALLPVPAFALRLAFGELADETLLSSARVLPARLLASAYAFRHPHLETALRHLLKMRCDGETPTRPLQEFQEQPST